MWGTDSVPVSVLINLAHQYPAQFLTRLWNGEINELHSWKEAEEHRLWLAQFGVMGRFHKRLDTLVTTPQHTQKLSFEGKNFTKKTKAEMASDTQERNSKSKAVKGRA